MSDTVLLSGAGVGAWQEISPHPLVSISRAEKGGWFDVVLRFQLVDSLDVGDGNIDRPRPQIVRGREHGGCGKDAASSRCRRRKGRRRKSRSRKNNNKVVRRKKDESVEEIDK